MEKTKTRRKLTFGDFYDKYGVLVTLVLLIGILTCLTDRFATPSNAINLLRQSTIYMILAFGVTFVFIGGGIDLSVGYNICFSSCVFALLVVESGVNMWLALLITMAIGTVIGAFNAFAVSVLRVNPFLATLGTQYILRGAALVITNETPVTGLPSEVAIFGGTTNFPIPSQAIIAAIVLIILFIVLNYTKLGRYTFAVGSNERSAKLSGVNVRLIRFADYMICGCCAALTGVVLCARLQLGSATLVQGYEMDAIAAVCIGGTSSGGGRGGLIKTVAGALVMSIIRNGLNILGLNVSAQYIIIGAVIIVVVAMDMLQQRREG